MHEVFLPGFQVLEMVSIQLRHVRSGHDGSLWGFVTLCTVVSGLLIQGF